MKKKLMVAAIIGAFLLSGCDAATRDKTNEYILPKELSDLECKIYRMQPDGAGDTLNVVFCPGGTTTVQYPVGKARNSVTTVDKSVDYGY